MRSNARLMTDPTVSRALRRSGPSWLRGQVTDAAIVDGGSASVTPGTLGFGSEATIYTATNASDLLKVTYSGWATSAVDRRTSIILYVNSVAITGTAGIAVGGANPVSIFLPYKIAPGDVVSAKGYSAVSTAGTVAVDAFQTNSIDVSGSGDLMIQYGVSAGAAKGFSTTTQSAWVQLAASTSNPIKGVCLIPSVHDASAGTNTILWELAYGPAGSEVKIAEIECESTSTELVRNGYGASSWTTACNIPAGSRLAVRVSGISASPEKYGITALVIRGAA